MNIDITDPELREVIEALGHHLFRLGIEKKRRREKTADGLLRRLKDCPKATLAEKMAKAGAEISATALTAAEMLAKLRKLKGELRGAQGDSVLPVGIVMHKDDFKKLELDMDKYTSAPRKPGVPSIGGVPIFIMNNAVAGTIETYTQREALHLRLRRGLGSSLSSQRSLDPK